MEKRDSAVLSAINSASPKGETVVIGKDELLSAIPQKEARNLEQLAAAVAELIRLNLIEMKYEDDGHYCLSSTPHGRAVGVRHSAEFASEAVNYKKIAVIALISAFIGAFIAVGLWKIIELLVTL